MVNPRSLSLSLLDLCHTALELGTNIWNGFIFVAVAQDLHNQEEAGEEDEAEPPHPTLDPHEDRQHHQVPHPAQLFLDSLNPLFIFWPNLIRWRFAFLNV